MYYDIIGDIHGNADALERLLLKLGYQPDGKGFTQPGHILILVGDLIDRRPGQRRVLEIARTMRDAGNAIVLMGNHEFNAICFAMPSANGGYIRPHKEGNVRQHQGFLDEFPFGSEDHKDAIEFFKSLPLWLDLETFRVVHACWDLPSMQVLSPLLDEQNRPSGNALFEGYDHKHSAIYEAAETVLKGPEVKLPDDVFFHDKDGKRRSNARVTWWKLNQGPERSFAVSPSLLAAHDMTTVWQDAHRFAYRDSKPLFFGHYWQRSFDENLQQRAIDSGQRAFCLDYSAAIDSGELVAATVSDTGLASPKICWSSVLAG